MIGRDGEPVDVCEWADLDPRHPHYRAPAALPDPWRCDDPWCCDAGYAHVHGTRPDGVRV